ncbi:MAG: CotH kinase family protein [Bacteroidota bacterium]
MLRYQTILSLFLLLFLPLLVSTQSSIDHWETVVYNNDIWTYQVGSSEPPSDWIQPQFDESNWQTDQGGLGYGDDDDNTIIPTTISLYIRIKFELFDTSRIKMAVLHADYDDAFVAYLNGTEFARGNFEAGGSPPAFDEIPEDDHEASLYRGELPEAFAIYPKAFDQLAKEGENTLAIQIHNYSISSSDLTSNFFLSLGIMDNSMQYDPTPSWFFEPFFATELPLLRINTMNQEIPNEPRIVANLQIVDNGPGLVNFLDDPATGYDGSISIEIRGASSQFFDKKNYGFETQDENGENNNVSLLGIPEENDWILHGPYSDKSLIRNVLTFEIGREMMDYASRTRFCELIINEDYRGIYVLMEKIKRDANRVDISALRPEDIEGDELTGGYIIQIDRDNEEIAADGWYSPYGGNPFYRFHHPDHDQLAPEQKEYIEAWITDFERAMQQPFFASIYDEYIDTKSFIDYFLINELAKHIDAFKLSFYMYKRKDSNGGKLHLGPIWDFNLGYGNFDFGCLPNPEGWIYPCISRAFWLEKIVDITAVKNRMYCRWQQLREQKLNTSRLMDRIDSMYTALSPAVDRNFNQFDILGTYIWPNSFVGDSYEEVVDFLKSWLTARLEWMDDNMFGNPTQDCDALLDVNQDDLKPSLNIFPNPFTSQISFFLSNESTIGLEVSIYDILGTPIVQAGLLPIKSLDLSYLPAGIYFYTLKDKSHILKHGRLIKQ